MNNSYMTPIASYAPHANSEPMSTKATIAITTTAGLVPRDVVLFLCIARSLPMVFLLISGNKNTLTKQVHQKNDTHARTARCAHQIEQRMAVCFFEHADVVRAIAGRHLNDDPRAVVMLSATCTVLWRTPQLPLNLVSLPQHGDRNLDVIVRSRYATSGLVLQLNGHAPTSLRTLPMNLLHTLHVMNCDAFEDLSALSTCLALRVVRLVLCHAVEDVSHLATCGSLREIHLKWCDGVTTLPDVSRCARLHTVCVTGCVRFHDTSALRACGTLRTLALNDCQRVSNVKDFAHCALLRTFECRNCSRFTVDQSVEE